MVICAAVFGGASSAFLPRLAHRLAVPSGARPRSACADCAAPFPQGRDGWVRTGRACRCAPAPWRTVAAGAAASGLLGATVGSTPLLPVLLIAVVLGVLLAVIDVRCLRLPDPLVAALAVLAVVPLVVLAGPGQLVRAALAAGLSFTAYAMIAILPGGGLGFGDVKLGAVLGFVLGFLSWPALAVGLVVPHLINGPIALSLLVRGKVGRRSALPFGPALLAGALIGVALG
jgi:leader peptidase (prepilin peptidase)/N-methyltransferase